eukprot:7832442-Karenia_brevis.AAC.1
MKEVAAALGDLRRRGGSSANWGVRYGSTSTDDVSYPPAIFSQVKLECNADKGGSSICCRFNNHHYHRHR